MLKGINFMLFFILSNLQLDLN